MPPDRFTSHRGIPRPSRRTLRILVAAILLSVLYLLSISFQSRSSLPTRRHAPVSERSSAADDPSQTFIRNSKFPPPLRDVTARGVPDVERDADNWYLARRREGREEFDWPNMNKMFVFGDSFCNLNKDYRKDGVDGGFTPRLVSYSTDAEYDANGGVPAVIKTIIQYWNFARDGAVIDRNVVAPRQESYGTFDTQIDDFRDLFTPMPGQWNVDWHSNDTLFIISLGVNDMGSIARLEYEPDDVVDAAQGLAKGIIAGARRLHSLGARSFLFLNVAPLERTPKFRLPTEVGHHGQTTIHDAVRLYNSFLAQAVKEFDEETPGINSMLFDWFSFYNLIYSTPEVFGLTELGRYSMVLNGRLMNHGRMGFFYHDNGHPSWTIADLLARAVHGYLLRHSSSFWVSNATANGLDA